MINIFMAGSLLCNNLVAHPDYDTFWQKNSPLNYVESAEIPQLHVAGYYDQEDINGPQLMYEHMEKKDKSNYNYIVLWALESRAVGKRQ